MTSHLMKLLGGMLFGGAVLVALTACASSTGAASSAPSPADASTLSAPAASAALATQQATQPADRPGDPLAKGKLLFEKTAGGVGCAACHGLDAKGNGPAGVNAPTIRGKNEGDVRAAIAGGVPMMTTIIKLDDDEIAAVVAYLDYLSQQP